MKVNSENVYFDALNDIVDKYNNAHHIAIKVKPINVKIDSFAKYNEESNEKDPIFKVNDHVKISKCKNIFAKGYAPNRSEEIFVNIFQVLSITYRSSGGNINVKLYLSSYARKTDVKNITHVDVSSSASKANIASLKTKVDKSDIDKLTPIPNDLAKLSNVVKNEVVKKVEYNELVKKVDNIDSTGFVLKM